MAADGASALLRGRELLTYLNVTETSIPAPPGYLYAITVLIPIIVLGSAILAGILCSISSVKALTGKEEPDVVIISDFQDKQSGGPSKVSTMYDWAKGVGAKVDQGKKDTDEVKVKDTEDDRVRLKRQRKIVDQLFSVIRENMVNLRQSAASIFDEFDNDKSGDISYWEFTKGLEKIGVKLSDTRLEMIMKDLDTDGSGTISLSEFEMAIALNQFRSMPPRSPDESTPIDPIWNRIHHALGSPDALTVIRLFDPEEVGAVGSEKFAEVLRANNAIVNAREFELISDILDPRETGIMDMALFANKLGASARRLESALLTKIFAAIEAHGGISFLGRYAQAESMLLSYNAMQMVCDDLATGIGSEELVLLFRALDANDSGHVAVDVLVYSMVAAWSATTGRLWLKVRKSALGQLRGEQAARVLTGGKAWVAYPDFSSALAANGIDMFEDDLLLLLVQLGSSIDGVVHAVDFANQMDHELSLALRSAYAKIAVVLSMEGVSLQEALARLDERSTGAVTHTQFVEFLRTMDIGLPNEDLVMLLARLDAKNEGRIPVQVLLGDMDAHTRTENAWAKISDALGPAGGAQIAAFVGDGSALATGALLAALRQLGVDLAEDEFALVLGDLDPRASRYAKVEAFTLLVRAHRERIASSVWIKLIQDITSGSDAVKLVVEAPPNAKAVFSHEQLLAGLVRARKIELTEAEIRTMMLALDPVDTGTVRASALEHEVSRALAHRRKGEYGDVAESSRMNVMHMLEGAQQELMELNAKPLHNEEEKVRLNELTMHVKLLEATIKNLNKWQKEVATLSGKKRSAEYEATRLVEVQRHIRICFECIRQTCKLQAEITALTVKGALSEVERMRLAGLHKQGQDLNDKVGRALKLQLDLAALNAKAIAKSGLTEAEKARAAVLRENLEPLAIEIRIADKRREESESEMSKRMADEDRARKARIERLWLDLSEHMRRGNISTKKIYRQFDESGRGELSYWEFFKGIQSIGIVYDEDDAELLMSTLDTEKKGFVAYAVFRKKLKDLDPAYQLRLQEKQRSREDAQREAESGLNAFLGGIFGTTTAVPGAGEEDEGDSEDDEAELSVASVDTKGALEAGTPVMAQHTTGDYFRATLVKDNLDGTCDVQYVLATLGRDNSLSKKKIRSLAQEEELRTIWVDVSRTVGRRGGNELRTKSDFAGMMSHEALITWLEERDMDAMSEHNKFVLLADVDPLHSGSIAIGRFLEKLDHFRARAKILGLIVFHRHDKEVVHDDAEDDEEKGGKSDSKPEVSIIATSSIIASTPGVSMQSQARMAELEALIFAMAKRQQELALALSASEARTAALNAAVQSVKEDPRADSAGEPLLESKGNSGLFIMPDVKDGGLVWLNKSTGMQFVRKDISSADDQSGEKKKKGRKSRAALKNAEE